MRHDPKTIEAADAVMEFIERNMRVESEVELCGGECVSTTSGIAFAPAQRLEIYDLMEKFRKAVLGEQ